MYCFLLITFLLQKKSNHVLKNKNSEAFVKYFYDFLNNYLLISALLGWLIAQILKVFTGMFSQEKFSLTRLLFSNGGMPSSHSATVMALTVAALLGYGVGSPVFAICAILSIIVMNDAVGVRQETGKQAKLINQIMREMSSGNPRDVETGLKELVGHTPLQVIMGAITGIFVAIALAFAYGIF